MYASPFVSLSASQSRVAQELVYRAIRLVAWALLALAATSYAILWKRCGGCCFFKKTMMSGGAAPPRLAAAGGGKSGKWINFSMLMIVIWLIVIQEILYVAVLDAGRRYAKDDGPNMTDVLSSDTGLAYSLIVISDFADASFMGLLMLCSTGFGITTETIKWWHLAGISLVAVVYLLSSIYVDVEDTLLCTGNSKIEFDRTTCSATQYNMSLFFIAVTFVTMWYFVFEVSAREAEKFAWATASGLRERAQRQERDTQDGAWQIDDHHLEDSSSTPGTATHAGTSAAAARPSYPSSHDEDSAAPSHADVVTARSKHRLMSSFSISTLLYAIASIMAIFLPDLLLMKTEIAAESDDDVTPQETIVINDRTFGTTASDILQIIQHCIFFALMVFLTVIFRPRTDSLYLQVSEGDVATTLSTDMGVVEMQEMPSSRSGGDVQHLA